MVLRNNKQLYSSPLILLPIFLFLCVFILFSATKCLAYGSCNNDTDCDTGMECVDGECTMIVQAERQSQKGYSPEVGIPDSEFEEGKNVNIEGTDAIGRYVKAIYNYGIGVVGILAAVVLMVGGVVWLTAGGNVNKVESAKQWIGGALTGLVLALTSYMLLYQINPDLVNFRTAGIGKVDPSEIDLPGEETKPGCCQYNSKGVSSMDCDNIQEGNQEACQEQAPSGYNATFKPGQECVDHGSYSSCGSATEGPCAGKDNYDDCGDSCSDPPCHCYNGSCISCGEEGASCDDQPDCCEGFSCDTLGSGECMED